MVGKWNVSVWLCFWPSSEYFTYMSLKNVQQMVKRTKDLFNHIQSQLPVQLAVRKLSSFTKGRFLFLPDGSGFYSQFQIVVVVGIWMQANMLLQTKNEIPSEPTWGDHLFTPLHSHYFITGIDLQMADRWSRFLFYKLRIATVNLPFYHNLNYLDKNTASFGKICIASDKSYHVSKAAWC